MLSSQVRSARDGVPQLRADWDRILGTCSRTVQGPDATCSWTWAEALRRTLLKETELQLLIVSADSQNVAIVPTYRQVAKAFPLDKRELRVITEVHAGRRGLLVAHDNPDIVEFVLGRLCADIPAWDVALLGAVRNSPSYAAIEEAARRTGFRMRSIAVQRSPYIELATSWDKMIATLPKKTRWTIRKSERELASKGSLTYERISEPALVDSLLASIFEIERNSWKQEAGSSMIVQSRQQMFYETLAKLAAENGMLSAHMLRLSSQPIAYILGITSADGVFLDLKESFDANFAEYSPGHVLKRFALESLIASGIRVYDFMGRCEAYKMRWTDKTYQCDTIALYRPTVRGSLFYLRSGLARAAAPAHPSTATVGGETACS